VLRGGERAGHRADRFNKKIKSGAPIMAVITPAGISPCSGRTLASTSQKIR
jgi:hypothetical protein